MTKFNVTKDFGDYKVGEAIDTETAGSLTSEYLSKLLNEGFLKPVLDETDFVDHSVTEEDLLANPSMKNAGIEVADIIKIPAKVSYRGQEVVSNGSRIVNGKEWRHIRTIDGTEYDLTESEYKDEIKPLIP